MRVTRFLHFGTSAKNKTSFIQCTDSQIYDGSYTRLFTELLCVWCVTWRMNLEFKWVYQPCKIRKPADIWVVARRSCSRPQVRTRGLTFRSLAQNPIVGALMLNPTKNGLWIWCFLNTFVKSVGKVNSVYRHSVSRSRPGLIPFHHLRFETHIICCMPSSIFFSCSRKTANVPSREIASNPIKWALSMVRNSTFPSLFGAGYRKPSSSWGSVHFEILRCATIPTLCGMFNGRFFRKLLHAISQKIFFMSNRLNFKHTNWNF